MSDTENIIRPIYIGSLFRRGNTRKEYNRNNKRQNQSLSIKNLTNDYEVPNSLFDCREHVTAAFVRNLTSGTNIINSSLYRLSVILTNYFLTQYV